MPVDNSGSFTNATSEDPHSIVDMAHEQLMRSLMVERYNNRWWKTPALEINDDDLTCARRRRQMAEDFAALDRPVSEMR